MSFFGFAIFISLITSAIIFNFCLQISVLANNESITYATYKNIQIIELFDRSINNTINAINTSNSTLYSNWMNAIEISAKQDNIGLKLQNKSLEIYINDKPSIFSIIKI